jgi:1-phosphofructokinase family hexose kinase
MIYTVTLNPAVDRELTVPAIVFDDVLRATEIRQDVGGKGFNVSRMLGSLGAASTALGFAGGAAGKLLEDGLNALGIGTDFVRVAGETRTNISIVPADHGPHIKVNEAGPTISAAEQTALQELVRARAQTGDWWVLAGSLPPGVQPAFYAQLFRTIQAAGARAVVDTSGAALVECSQERPFLLKPNGAELAQLTGHPVNTIAEAVAEARAMDGVQQIVISMGKDGAVLVEGAQAWLVTPPRIQQRNPIGAGDSLVGGLVYGLSQGEPLLEALKWGVACGAATAARAGTAVGTRDEVLALRSQVQVREL